MERVMVWSGRGHSPCGSHHLVSHARPLACLWFTAAGAYREKNKKRSKHKRRLKKEWAMRLVWVLCVAWSKRKKPTTNA